MSCKFQTLFSGEEGYIVRCKECGHYQIAFISVLVNMSEESYFTLYGEVRQLATCEFPFEKMDAKRIMIPTPSKNVFFILTPKELLKLWNIMEVADTEMKIQEMLYLFQ